jgi:hypothetical protein
LSHSAPAVVGDLTVYKRGRRMLGLRWSKPNLTYGTLSSFTLTTKQATGEEPVSVRVEAKPCAAWPELYCHTLNNLIQDHEYEISVRKCNLQLAFAIEKCHCFFVGFYNHEHTIFIKLVGWR